RGLEISHGESDDGRPVLGEKGVGRLAAMRLGSRLCVQTTKAGEPEWHTLEVNWDHFAQDLDARLEDIQVKLGSGDSKKDKLAQGTRIRIFGLASNWTREHLRSI